MCQQSAKERKGKEDTKLFFFINLPTLLVFQCVAESGCSKSEGSYGLKCLLGSIWIVAHGDFVQGGKRAAFVCAERRKIDGGVQKMSDE